MGREGFNIVNRRHYEAHHFRRPLPPRRRRRLPDPRCTPPLTQRIKPTTKAKMINKRLVKRSETQSKVWVVLVSSSKGLEEGTYLYENSVSKTAFIS